MPYDNSKPINREENHTESKQCWEPLKSTFFVVLHDWKWNPPLHVGYIVQRFAKPHEYLPLKVLTLPDGEVCRITETIAAPLQLFTNSLLITIKNVIWVFKVLCALHPNRVTVLASSSLFSVDIISIKEQICKNSLLGSNASRRPHLAPVNQSIPASLQKKRKKKNRVPVVTAINRKQLIKIYEGDSSPGHRNCPLIGGWRVANGC